MNELGIQCPGNEFLNNQAVDVDTTEAVPSGHHKVYPTAPETPRDQKGNRTNILTNSLGTHHTGIRLKGLSENVKMNTNVHDWNITEKR